MIPLAALNMGRQKTVILHLLVFSLRSPIQPHLANYNAIQYIIMNKGLTSRPISSTDLDKIALFLRNELM